MKAITRSILALLPLAALPLVSAQESNKASTSSEQAGQKSTGTWRATKLIGTDLKTSNNELIGEIKDIVLDLPGEKVVGFVVSAGGFLGVNGTVSVIPSSTVRYEGGSEGFVTSYDKNEVEQAPRWKDSEWSAADGNVIMEKLRALRDSIGGDTGAPDNSARNESDMKDKALTPLDQGTSEEDLATTRSIRAAVVKSDLSFNAKNVKIITKDGTVTLRGVAETKEEKAAVLKLAQESAGEAKVHDEISVK